MAAPSPSSFSKVCSALSRHISDNIIDDGSDVRVVIGKPADAEPAEQDSDHKINLFFYRIDPYQFSPDTASGETLLTKTYCLITPFAVTEDNISSGENDLRFLGEVMRVLHEKPFVNVAIGEDQFFVQIIQQGLSTDEINQIWSNQRDVTYRPSVAYEVSITPIIPTEKKVPAPLVGEISFVSIADVEESKHREVSADDGVSFRPIFDKIFVDTRRNLWEQQISFAREKMLFQSISTPLNGFSTELAKYKLVVAGEKGEKVKLTWSKWATDSGWQDLADTKEIKIDSNTVDYKDSTVKEFAINPPSVTEKCQLLLKATRELENGSAISSNPLIISVYEDS